VPVYGELTINHRDFKLTTTNQETPHHQSICMSTVQSKQVSNHLSVSREERIGMATTMSRTMRPPAGWRVIDIGGAIEVPSSTIFVACTEVLPEATVDKGNPDSSRRERTEVNS
jgi:hypothetical protein